MILLLSVYLLYALTANVILKKNQDQDSKVTVLYPDCSITKIKPKNSNKFVVSNSDNLVYQQWQKPISKKVNILPEPELPISIKGYVKKEDNIAFLENMLTEKSSNNIIRNFTSLVKNKELNIIKVDSQLISKEKNRFLKTKVYRVQVSSAKSIDVAIKEGERLKSKYEKIFLNSKLYYIKERGKNGTFFYMILLGDYKTLNQAKSVCKKLAYKQQECIISNL